MTDGLNPTLIKTALSEVLKCRGVRDPFVSPIRGKPPPDPDASYPSTYGKGIIIRNVAQPPLLFPFPSLFYLWQKKRGLVRRIIYRGGQPDRHKALPLTPIRRCRNNGKLQVVGPFKIATGRTRQTRPLISTPAFFNLSQKIQVEYRKKTIFERKGRGLPGD